MQQQCVLSRLSGENELKAEVSRNGQAVIQLLTYNHLDLFDIWRYSMNPISWDDFTKVELRVGRIIQAEPFPEARKPAYKLLVDFGPDIGQRKSSAQITHLYKPEELQGKLVVAVMNFPPKQIGPIMSECLVTGFHNEQGEVALCVPDKPVPLGTKLL